MCLCTRSVRQLVSLLSKKIVVSDRSCSDKRHYNVGRNTYIRRATVNHEIEGNSTIDCDRDGKGASAGNQWDDSSGAIVQDWGTLLLHLPNRYGDRAGRGDDARLAKMV
jgi:hypothetical protein